MVSKTFAGVRNPLTTSIFTSKVTPSIPSKTCEEKYKCLSNRSSYFPCMFCRKVIDKHFQKKRTLAIYFHTSNKTCTCLPNPLHNSLLFYCRKIVEAFSKAKGFSKQRSILLAKNPKRSRIIFCGNNKNTSQS